MSDEQEPTGGTVIEQQSSTTIPNRPLRVDWPPLVFGGVLTLAYTGIVITLMFIKLPEGSESIVVPLVNRLGDVFMMAMAYLYVTTASSNKKTDLLAKAGPVDPH